MSTPNTSAPFSDIAIRPLSDTTALPQHSGADGVNRAPPGRLIIQATNDLEALQCFLVEFVRSAGTQRIYQRECERLFLWAWVERNKPVSSLTRQDFEDYLAFLKDPQPATRWCGPRAPRVDKRWRPFVGPLHQAALLTAIAALDSLMSYWVDSGYLVGNPLGLIKQRTRLARERSTGPRVLDEDAKVERFLDAEMWSAVTAAIESMPRESPQQLAEYERLRFICAFLYLLAPRAGELETLRMNSFREEHGRWWWYVVGKGDKAAKVPVPDAMMEALVRYRKFLGLSAVPSRQDDTPLLVSVRNGEPITARRLNQLLKTLFSTAARMLPEASSYKREKLASASAHWGRHTGITAKVQSGMDARYVQKDARHADARTTSLYIHEEDERWHDEAQKQQLPWAQPKG